MKNYGDPLTNCNDNEENTKESINLDEEKSLPNVETSPKVKYYYSLILYNIIFKFICYHLIYMNLKCNLKYFIVLNVSMMIILLLKQQYQM